MRQNTLPIALLQARQLLGLIAGLLLALVLVVGYKLAPLWLPYQDLDLQPDPRCDLQRENCRVAVPGGGSIELAMGSRPIPLARPFAVEVISRDFTPDRVEIDFTALDMNMGRNRISLAARGDGRHVGEASLPVCITGGMRWQATLLVEHGRQRLAIPYRFDANVSL